MRSWDKYCEDTERIFKLQQQNKKLREEIRKIQRGIDFPVIITGSENDNSSKRLKLFI